MSDRADSHPAPTLERPPRPMVVSIAATCMLIASAGLVVSQVPALYAGRRIEVFREAYAGTVAEQAVADLSTMPFYVFGGLVAGIALIVALSASLALRGSNFARVTGWLLGGLLVCGAIPALALEPSPPPRPPGAPPAPVIEQMLASAVPSWVDPVAWTGTIVGVLGLLVAIVLFGLPRSNDFFRKPPPVNTPPPPLAGG